MTILPIGSNHLDEYQKAFLTSKSFFENILKPLLKQLLSNHLKKASNFVVEQNKNITFFRKWTIFDNKPIGRITQIYCLLLTDGIYHMLEKLGNLDWHSSEFTNSTGGASLTATRRAMASNITQPSLIVAQHSKQNKIGLPSITLLFRRK
jgi:hypothetical protein